jgi:hypothetical protein
MSRSDSKYSQGSGGANATAGALWRRAPLWRFFVLTAGLLTLVFVLFPPSGPGIQLPMTSPDRAAYTPPVRNPQANTVAAAPPGIPQASGTKPIRQQQPVATKPKQAVLSMVTPNSRAPTNDTGLDPALLGPLYRSSVTIDGYAVPLPPGEWANLAHSTIAMATANGDVHFLGRIRDKRLIGAVRAFAVRSKDQPGAGFPEVKSCTEENPGRTYVAIDGAMTTNGHQACWTIRTVYATPWSRWADRAVKLSAIDRAAAGDMTATGVTYPQDFVSVTFTRTETWGLLEVMYMFSPEIEHISSNTALSVNESDWTPANVGRYPEKVAYIDKLKAWGVAFWPRFKQAFDDAQQPGK